MLFTPACPSRADNVTGEIKHAYKMAEKNAELTEAEQARLLQSLEKGQSSLSCDGDQTGKILQRK